MATIHLILFWTVHTTIYCKQLFINFQEDLTSKYWNYYVK